MSRNRNKRVSNSVDLSSSPLKKKKKNNALEISKKETEKPIYTSDDSSSSDSSDDQTTATVASPVITTEPIISNGAKDENENKIDLPVFTMADMNKLLVSVKNIIPDSDSLKYNTRLEKLDWETVKFNNYSADDCKKLFNHGISFIRKYKTLTEVINETQVAASKATSKMYRLNNGPQKPKHPSSSYMIFANEIRDKLRKQNPNLSIIEIGKLIGEKWRQLATSKKEKYLKQFEENKKAYLEEVSKFNIEHNQPEKKKKELDKPKTPLMIFLSEKLEKENPDLEGKSSKEKQTYYKNKYNTLSDKKKFKYIKKCMEAEDQFVEKLKDKLKTINVEYKSVLNKNERDIVEKMNGKPDNPPVNGYALFIKENINRPDIASVDSKLRNSILATKWKELERAEKDAYNNRAKLAQEQYLLDMTNYVKNLPEKQAIELYMSSTASIGKDIIARRIESLSK